MVNTVSTSSSEAKRRQQMLFKILVIGDVGTGKSSIVRRYVHNVFSQNYKATVGVDFALKLLVWNTEMLLRLQLWDLSGQDRFGNMTRVYYKDAHGAVIVFDSTRRDTYFGALRWKTDLDNKASLANGEPVPSILLANKCDIPNEVTDETLKGLCEKEGFIGGFHTSAKENIGISEAFKFLATYVLQKEKEGKYEISMLQRDGSIRQLDIAAAIERRNRKSRCCT